MIVGLVALGTLPFNWAGIVLLALAAVLIFFEIQAPGLGFLGVGGVIAFVLGTLLLFSVGEPDFPDAPSRQDKPVAGGHSVGADCLLSRCS